MKALLRLHRPSELTVEHLGAFVSATESTGLVEGGLSDFQHCPAVLPAQTVPLLTPDVSCPSHPPRTDAHTHLWVCGVRDCVSEARGRVAVAVPIDPTTGLPVPGETQ